MQADKEWLEVEVRGMNVLGTTWLNGEVGRALNGWLGERTFERVLEGFFLEAASSSSGSQSGSSSGSEADSVVELEEEEVVVETATGRRVSLRAEGEGSSSDGGANVDDDGPSDRGTVREEEEARRKLGSMRALAHLLQSSDRCEEARETLEIALNRSLAVLGEQAVETLELAHDHACLVSGGLATATTTTATATGATDGVIQQIAGQFGQWRVAEPILRNLLEKKTVVCGADSDSTVETVLALARSVTSIPLPRPLANTTQPRNLTIHVHIHTHPTDC